MKKFLILLMVITPFVYSAALSANNHSVDDLFKEFDSEMRQFIADGAPYVLIKQHYNRLSNTYFKRCNIEFNKSPQCRVFQESFFHWYYKAGGSRMCRSRQCINH